MGEFYRQFVFVTFNNFKMETVNIACVIPRGVKIAISYGNFAPAHAELQKIRPGAKFNIAVLWRRKIKIFKGYPLGILCHKRQSGIVMLFYIFEGYFFR